MFYIKKNLFDMKNDKNDKVQNSSRLFKKM